jgi:hypothetical protein
MTDNALAITDFMLSLKMQINNHVNFFGRNKCDPHAKGGVLTQLTILKYLFWAADILTSYYPMF